MLQKVKESTIYQSIASYEGKNYLLSDVVEELAKKLVITGWDNIKIAVDQDTKDIFEEYFMKMVTGSKKNKQMDFWKETWLLSTDLQKLVAKLPNLEKKGYKDHWYTMNSWFMLRLIFTEENTIEIRNISPDLENILKAVGQNELA